MLSLKFWPKQLPKSFLGLVVVDGGEVTDDCVDVVSSVDEMNVVVGVSVAPVVVGVAEVVEVLRGVVVGVVDNVVVGVVDKVVDTVVGVCVCVGVAVGAWLCWGADDARGAGWVCWGM